MVLVSCKFRSLNFFSSSAVIVSFSSRCFFLKSRMLLSTQTVKSSRRLPCKYCSGRRLLLLRFSSVNTSTLFL